MTNQILHNPVSFIKVVKGFPSTDVSFIDMSKFYSTPGWHQILEKFRIDDPEAIFLGVESRGFIIASALATIYGMGFGMIRKAGKLPNPSAQIAYSLEYGEGKLESPESMPKKAYIVDDVTATGGTLMCARQLCLQTGCEVLGLLSLVNIPRLNSKMFAHLPTQNIINANLSDSKDYTFEINKTWGVYEFDA
jgi:adenine phosphoribosyltransferase